MGLMLQRLLAAYCSVALCSSFVDGAPTSQPSVLAALSTAGDVDGESLHLSAHHRSTAVIFLGTECPISARAIATLNAIHKDLAEKETTIDLVGVISDASVTRKAAAEFRKSYAAEFPIVFDASGDLAAALHPTHVPDAFVLDEAGTVIYDGRIDDSFAAIGKPAQVVKHTELKNAIDDLIAKHAVAVAHADPVGCIFESAPTTKSASANAPTYSRDISPIMNENCATCHRPGEVAPFSLTTFADVAKRAEMIAHVTNTHYMPPWKPVGETHRFADERKLADTQIDRIAAWAAAGAPAGNPDDLPPVKVATGEWKLGKPDCVVTMSEAFHVPASGRDVYRAFVVPIDVPDGAFVSGTEFRAGAPTVVHHCLLYLDDSGKARELDKADPEPGYKSFGGPGFTPSGGLGGWAPGAQPYLLPDGVGRPIHKGADVVMQIHYHPDGKPHDDISSVAVYFTKKPVKEYLAGFMVGTRDIDIPAGKSDYVRHASMTLPVDTRITTIVPHMHLIGHSMNVTATKPDGSIVPLIRIDDWDFRWQDQYLFQQPLSLPAGTKIDVEAVYDNSEANERNPNNPPKAVHHGEQTTDEMCLCFFSFQTGKVSDIRAIRRAMVMQRLGLNRDAAK